MGEHRGKIHIFEFICQVHKKKISERKNRFLFQICSAQKTRLSLLCVTKKDVTGWKKNVFKTDFGKKKRFWPKNMFFAIGMKCIHMFIVANISTYM
jgi:hypothetical protein